MTPRRRKEMDQPQAVYSSDKPSKPALTVDQLRQKLRNLPEGQAE